MRKNNAFVAKIANTHSTKICVAISERLPTSATLSLADNGGPQILWSRRRAQRRGDFFQAAIALHCSVAVCADCAVPASEVVGRDVPRGQGGRNGRFS